MSVTKITLPSGATVTLKDLKELRIKDRKKVMKIADSAEGGDLSRAMALGDALIAMMIEDWSFDLIIPSVKLEALDELDVIDYDFLIEQTKEAQKHCSLTCRKRLKQSQTQKQLPPIRKIKVAA